MSSVISLWEQKLAVSGQEIFPFQIASVLTVQGESVWFQKNHCEYWSNRNILFKESIMFFRYFFLLYRILCKDTTYIISIDQYWSLNVFKAEGIVVIYFQGKSTAIGWVPVRWPNCFRVPTFVCVCWVVKGVNSCVMMRFFQRHGVLQVVSFSNLF